MSIGDIGVVLPEPEQERTQRYQPPEEGGSYDLVIIGGGPAGMTGAVYAARKRINTLLVSVDLGGQMLWTSEVENYLGYYYVEAKELVRKFEEQVKQYPIDIGFGQEVTGLKPADGSFAIETRSGSHFQARTVIIATGKRSRTLNVPGEKELRGRGVTYCATCDAPLFAGKDVVVVGGGNSAFTAVADLLPIATKIAVVNLTDGWQADAVLRERAEGSSKFVSYLGHEVVRILGDDRVQGIVIKSRKTGEQTELAVEGVFVEIGLLPNSEFVRGLVQLNEWGEIEVDCRCETNVPGIFAAGDVTMVPEKQIIVAAGEGSKAALAAYDFLLKAGVKLGESSAY